MRREAEPEELDRRFGEKRAPGVIPKGDQCCFSLSPPRLDAIGGGRRGLCGGAGGRCGVEPARAAGFAKFQIGFRQATDLVKLEHYGPASRACCCRTSRMSAMASTWGGCARAIRRRGLYLSRRAAELLLAIPASTFRWIIFCSIPTIRNCSRGSGLGNCCPPWRGNSRTPNPISKARGGVAEIRSHLRKTRTNPFRL